MAGLFGTSGMRGVYGKEITPEIAMRVGNAIGERGKRVMVAIDARATSPLLAESLAAGAMYAGSDVVFLGMVPTPVLAYATHREKCNGAMITASHNPPEYNGIKLFSNGLEFTREQEGKVEASVFGNENTVGWNEAGKRIPRDFSKEYISYACSMVDEKAILKRKPRVLVDAGNAAACKVAPALLRKAGCLVVELYCDLPGKFIRNLEPKKETLSEAAKMVVEKGCDFGVAFDGDGDRAVVIDEEGRVLALDVQLSLFCDYFLAKGKGKKIVSTVEASLCVKETVEKSKGMLEITPVGSLHVAQEMKKGAAFGGEPCGEYVFAGGTPCADGLLASLFVAELFCERGSIAALAGAVKTYPIERRKYPCENEKKDAIMKALASSFLFEGANVSRMDGLRFDFSDGWLLIRPSGTEPAIRLTCEFVEKKRLEKIVHDAEEMIIAAIGSQK